MRFEVRIGEEVGVSADAGMRLRFVLSRFAASVARVALQVVACGPGRMRLRGRVRFLSGDDVSLSAEDEASEAAVMHFIDRLGRAVARRRADPGGRHV